MTGYGKAEVLLETGKVTVEIRSLNGKTADNVIIDWDVNTNFWAEGSNIVSKDASGITVTKAISKAAINQGCRSRPYKGHKAVICIPYVYHIVKVIIRGFNL